MNNDEALGIRSNRQTNRTIVWCLVLVALAHTTARAQSPAVTDILARYDVGPSQFEMFQSGAALSPAEEDVLVKILYHFPRLGLENIARWRVPAGRWDQIVAMPASARATIFLLRGRATHVERVTVLPEQAELFEFRHYYRVTMTLDDSRYQAQVAVRSVPAAWKIGAPLDEPTEADAMFLKVGEPAGDSQTLLFAGDRVGWLPDRPAPEHFVGPPQIALARLGMDISLWDSVRESKELGLTLADREAFYRLLAVVGRPDAADLSSLAAAELELPPLLERSAEHLGDIFTVEGTARRITKVAVSDADVRLRFGIDHYYEIDLFVPLGKASLRLGNDPTGQKSPVFHNAFPATLVVRRLPPGLREGDNLHEQVRASGVFFKVWTFRSKFTSQFGQLQPAPLFIAGQPALVEVATTANWVTSALVTTALVLAVAVAGLLAWWQRSGDRRTMSRRTLTADRPDFSGLKDR